MSREYDTLISALRGAGMYVTLSALESAVTRESEDLQRVLGGKVADHRKDAEDYYAAEIVDKLYNSQPVTPEQILGNRRTPTAWAIAEIMRREGVKA